MESKGQDLLSQALLNYRAGKHDKKIHGKLQKEGERVLEKLDPSKAKLSRINVHSIFWIISSIGIFYLTDFYEALRFDSRVDWLWLYPGSALLFVALSIGGLCIVWHHYIKGNPDYDKDLPWAIPVATSTFLLGMISACVALWPVYGIFTPFILFTFFMGIVFFTTSLPI